MLPSLHLKFSHCCEVHFIALCSPIITIILTMSHARCYAITLKTPHVLPSPQSLGNHFTFTVAPSLWKTQHELSWRGKTILQKQRRGKRKLPSKLMFLLEKSVSKTEMSAPFITRIISTRLGSLGMVTLAFLPSIAVNFACPQHLT